MFSYFGVQFSSFTCCFDCLKIRVLEQEKKIADLEEMTKNPEKRDEYRESELTKMKAAIEVSRPFLCD